MYVPSAHFQGAQELQYRVTFEVLESWKGVTSRRLELVTGGGGGDCGYPFVVGKRYLVFAETTGLFSKTELEAGLCSFTQELIDARDNVKKLRAWRTPRKFSAREPAG